MRSVTRAILLMFVGRTQASAKESMPASKWNDHGRALKEDETSSELDKLLDRLSDRVTQNLDKIFDDPGFGQHPHVDLDQTTQGKPGNIAIQSSSRSAGLDLKPVRPLRAAQAHANPGEMRPFTLRGSGIGSRQIPSSLSARVPEQRQQPSDSRGGSCVLRAVAGFKEEAEANALLQALQGKWEDDQGNEITIDGEVARFSDWPGDWPIAYVAGRLILRGTQFVGTPEKPRWRFPSGELRDWVRRKPITPEQKEWSETFLGYKAAQMQLRRQLWASVIGEDFKAAARYRTAYTEGQANIPSGASLEKQARLHSGKHLVPGTCFRHKKFGYRGVIIACEPWCAATIAWKEKAGVEDLARGENQPFYHCLPDMRDRPGHSPKHAAFLAEEVLEPTEEAFPVHHPFAAMLLVQCEEIKGYLPTPMLEDVLRNQSASGKFSLVQKR